MLARPVAGRGFHRRRGSRRGIAVALLCAASLALDGCTALGILPPVAVAGAIEGVSLNQTGKTGTDHLASLVTGEDCSVLRYTKGGKYCLTEAEVAKQKALLHRPYDGACYRVRGGVTCYEDQDATHTSETMVYNNP